MTSFSCNKLNLCFNHFRSCQLLIIHSFFLRTYNILKRIAQIDPPPSVFWFLSTPAEIGLILYDIVSSMWIIKITDRTQDVLFSRFLCVSFLITLQGRSSKELRVVGVEQALSLSVFVLRRLHVTSLGFWLAGLFWKKHFGTPKTFRKFINCAKGIESLPQTQIF